MTWVQPALKLMERLSFTSASPFSSCCSPLAAPVVSLALILACLQLLPKHRASCSVHKYRQKEGETRYYNKLFSSNPFTMCAGQGAPSGSVEGAHRAPLSRQAWAGAPAFPSCSHSDVVASTSTAKSYTAALCSYQTPHTELLRSLDAIPCPVLVECPLLRWFSL